MKIKIKKEHADHIRRAIAPLDTPERREQYRTGNFPNSEKVIDLNMRYRWDLTHDAQLTLFLCRDVYRYANDNNVDTVLRSIVPNL